MNYRNIEIKSPLILICGWTMLCLFHGETAAAQILFPTNSEALPDLTFTTQAYQKEALKILIHEANVVASQLNLPENLPITEISVDAKYVDPFGAAQFFGAIGNISTSKYTYYVSKGLKFSHLEWGPQEELSRKFSRDYNWPISREDTNSAYQLATQWLGAVSMDVNGLNRDCDLHVFPFKVKGDGTNAVFAPIYWVNWTKGGWGHGSVAVVELYLPTKTLMQLRVNDPKYILRPPIVFTNLAELLSQTNAPSVTNERPYYLPRRNLTQ